MDSFVKRDKRDRPSIPSGSGQKKRKEQSDFLSVASRKFEHSNTDVGVDIIGELKDNLDNVVEYFKLVKEFENIKGEIQQFQFVTPFPAKEYRLIEMPPALLEAFDRGESFTFRGEADDNAVLCSATRTYGVQETETSNTLVLTPKIAIGDQVAGGLPTLTVREVPTMARHYLELKEQTFVSKARLSEILRENELSDWLTDSCEKRWSLDALLDVVRMSEGELVETLAEWPVVMIEGSYRWLSSSLRCELLDAAVEAIDDQCLAADRSITHDLLRGALPDRAKYPDVLLEWVLQSHFNVVEKPEGGGAAAGKKSYLEPLPPCVQRHTAEREASTTPSSRREKVRERVLASGPPSYLAAARPFCRTRARQLLPLVKNYPAAEFEQKLEKIVPIGVLLSWEFLDGLALRTTSVNYGERIEYFCADDLPEAPRERLGLLFTTRPAWTEDEIGPFVTPILPRGTALSSFLHQHCRAETGANGVKTFCALKPL